MAGRILVFIPMFNCSRQIGRVLRQFDDVPQGLVGDVLMLDNGSTDDTVVAAQAAGARLAERHGPTVTICRNRENYSLGGSHKVAFNYALDHGFDHVVVLHGDDQGDIRDVVPLLQAGRHRQVDCLLGSRFMRGSRLTNYSMLRIAGNRVFNAAFSAVTGRWLTDLGSGLNVYKASFLASRFYLRFPDALTFNYYMILYTAGVGASFEFFPLTWRDEDQTSNVRLVRQTLRMLTVLRQYATGRTAFMTAAHERERTYESDVLIQLPAHARS